MAQFDLELNRVHDPAAFPDRCARCGAAGTTLVPVPEHYTKQVEGLAVPLCPAHVDDWTAVKSRNRIGTVILLLAIAAAMAAVWVLHPQFAKPNEQDTLSRVTATIVFGIFGSVPLVILVVLWAKTPIRVMEKQGRFITLAGVGRKFAKSMEASAPSPALPPISDEAPFEVSEYRPAGTCPPEVAGRLLAVTLISATVFGLLVGLIGLEFGRFTDDWHRNDWRYLGLTPLVAIAYFVPLLVRSGALLLFIARLLIVILIVLAMVFPVFIRLVGGSFEIGFGVVFTGGSLLLLAILVTHRLTRKWHVRSAPVAVAAAAGGPLVLTGIVYLIAGTEPGPHTVVYYLGPIVALVAGALNRQTARAPYCSECEEWLYCPTPACAVLAYPTHSESPHRLTRTSSSLKHSAGPSASMRGRTTGGGGVTVTGGRTSTGTAPIGGGVTPKPQI